jgi:pimeloyl-ACP methyl ester carboxylesterase/DNA-binding SARP family transcriptional activator
MSKVLTFEETSIYYEFICCQKNEAETVLLVHGLGLDMSTWDEVVELMKMDYNILRYDLQGHGKSARNKGKKISWDLLVNDLELLLNTLKINSFHFIGHSGGGNLGLELEKRMKGYIKSLILISTPIYVPKDISNNEIKGRNNWRQEEKIDNIVLPIAKNICYPATSSKVERILNIFRQVSVETYLEYFNFLGQTILQYNLEEFNKFSIPKILFVGEFDGLYPPKLQMMNLSYLSNTRFLIIPNASNAIMVDQPTRFVEDTVNFIEGLDKKEESKNYTYTEILDNELNSIVDTGIKLQDHSIYLNIIDKFELIIDGIFVEGKWNQRKSMQIITYIIYHHSVTREQLYEAFWRNYDISKARNSLRVSINHIKAIIEECTGKSVEEYFNIDRDKISVRNKAIIDITNLQQVLAQIEYEKNDQEKITKALALFSSLPENISPIFYDDWIINVKGEIENKILDICEELLTITTDTQDRVELLKVMIKYNPMEELHYRELFSLIGSSSKDFEYYNRKLNQFYE